MRAEAPPHLLDDPRPYILLPALHLHRHADANHIADYQGAAHIDAAVSGAPGDGHLFKPNSNEELGDERLKGSGRHLMQPGMEFLAHHGVMVLDLRDKTLGQPFG